MLPALLLTSSGSRFSRRSRLCSRHPRQRGDVTLPVFALMAGGNGQAALIYISPSTPELSIFLFVSETFSSPCVLLLYGLQLNKPFSVIQILSVFPIFYFCIDFAVWFFFYLVECIGIFFYCS